MIDLAAVAGRHSQLLFGEPIDGGALKLTLVSRESRHIYRLQHPGRPYLGAVVAKLRLPRSAAERELGALETANEFAVLSAVRSELDAQGRPENTVPRPLLVLPQDSLIFMEHVPGHAVSRFLGRWTLGLRSLTQTSEQFLRCGEWLEAFNRLPSGAIPKPPPGLASVFETRRVRHHVYRLIGLSGSALVEAMLAGIEKRLIAYGVPAWQRRIERAYAKQFREFGPSRDVQGVVHGKYSPADIFIHERTIAVLDLEQGGVGSAYLDIAYFLYQAYMTTRWRPRSGGERGLRACGVRFSKDDSRSARSTLT